MNCTWKSAWPSTGSFAGVQDPRGSASKPGSRADAQDDGIKKEG